MPRDQNGVVRDSGGGGGGAGGGGGTGAPTDADYLVGTANGDLSNEIVVGATPGGELGGTWASPTVDATHSGSSHAATAATAQAAAESTAATNLASHEADTTNIHGITNTALLETTAGAQAKADAKVADAINDATTTVAPSQNAVFDALALKAPLASPTFTGSPAVPDDAYDAATWNGSTVIPTKNAVRDKIESILAAVVLIAGSTSTGLQTFAAGIKITDDDGSTVVDGYRALLFLTPPAADDAVRGLVFKYPDVHPAINYAESDAIGVLSDALDTGLTTPTPIHKIITSTTNATPVVVLTSTAHGLTTGQVVSIVGTGIAALDKKFWKVTVTDSTHFSLDTSTAPGSTAAAGEVYTDQKTDIFRVADTGPGTVAQHIAVGLRGRSGNGLPTYGLQIANYTPDAPNLQLLNTPSTALTATPTGVYLEAIDVRAANAVRFQVNSIGQTLHDAGSTTVPGITFVGDSDTGFSDVVANNVSVIAGGVIGPSFSATAISLPDAVNISVGATTGSKIGTATTQKIGFWNATPVARPAAVTGSRAGNVALAGLLSSLASIGLIVDSTTA